MESASRQQHQCEDNFPCRKMYTVQYLRMLFCSMTMAMIVTSSLLNSFEAYMPVYFKRTFRYGKFAYRGKASFVNSLEVPKAWFRHFYVYSAPLAMGTLALVVSVYVFDVSPPWWLLKLLDNDGAVRWNIPVNPINVLLAISLLTLQCTRRLYDTQYVSVFGKNARMNLCHYIVGIMHYPGALLAILCEAPIFASSDSVKLNLFDLQLRDILAIGLFLVAWVHQYRVTVILANLRKNSKGHVVSEEYKLPEGDWFKYISSPHSTTEIMMYFSIGVILWGNITWWFVFIWVLTNQVQTMLLSHWWYQETFKNFPTERKALIPFIY